MIRYYLLKNVRVRICTLEITGIDSQKWFVFFFSVRIKGIIYLILFLFSCVFDELRSTRSIIHYGMMMIETFKTDIFMFKKLLYARARESKRKRKKYGKSSYEE